VREWGKLGVLDLEKTHFLSCRNIHLESNIDTHRGCNTEYVIIFLFWYAHILNSLQVLVGIR
jgi:hypothetical protein